MLKIGGPLLNNESQTTIWVACQVAWNFSSGPVVLEQNLKVTDYTGLTVHAFMQCSPYSPGTNHFSLTLKLIIIITSS